MTQTVHIAYPELRRTARESLRVAGLHLSQADEAADALAWTEATIGLGLQALRGAPLRSPYGLSVGITDTHHEIVAAGSCLLSIGQRLVDYALSELQGSDGLKIHVQNTKGAQFTPYLVNRLKNKGLIARAEFHGHEGDVFVRAWTGTSNGHNDVLVSLATTAPSSEMAWSDIPGSLELSVARVLDASRPGCATAVPGMPVLGRLQRAMAGGLDVDRSDYAVLTGLSARVRVPTSERSRRQAG